MLTAAQPGKEQPFLWGLPASLVFHALLVVALLLSPAARMLAPPANVSVAVEIFTPEQFQAAVETEPRSAAPPAILDAPLSVPETVGLPGPTPVPEAKTAGEMIVAKTMLSERTLADPRSSQARRELATFSDGERIVQLCNLEAMDQVVAWQGGFRPDRLVAYAKLDVKMSGETVIADGAAFRSSSNWYDIRYRCRVSQDHAKVVAFEFQVGDPVPPGKWEELNLPSVH